MSVEDDIRLTTYAKLALVEAALLPVSVRGSVAFAVRVVARSRCGHGSMTAYEPAFARLMMHLLGKREDEAGERLISALPAVSRRAVRAMLAPTVLALRLSGATIAMYDYPIYRSTSIWTAFGHRTRFFDDAIDRRLDEVDQSSPTPTSSRNRGSTRCEGPASSLTNPPSSCGRASPTTSTTERSRTRCAP